MQSKKYYTIVILVCTLNTLYFAQSQTEKIFRIGFVQSLSTAQDIKDKSFFDKISSWLLGDDNIVLNKPIAVITDNLNNITVLDQGLQNLVSFNLEHKYVKSFSLNFPSLVAICQYSKDKRLFTDSQNNKIYVLDFNNEIHSLNDSLIFNKPTGLGYVKSTQEIWVSETGTHSIVVLDSLGKFITRIGKRGNEEGEFNFPTNIWVDKNELIYIVDAINFRIQIFDKSGQFVSMFGEQGDATGYFARPKGIATDSFGNIYVVDALFHNVQIFDFHGNYLYNFGGQGLEKGKFWLPNGIYIDENDKIYVADSYNSRIQIFKLIHN